MKMPLNIVMYIFIVISICSVIFAYYPGDVINMSGITNISNVSYPCYLSGKDVMIYGDVPTGINTCTVTYWDFVTDTSVTKTIPVQHYSSSRGGLSLNRTYIAKGASSPNCSLTYKCQPWSGCVNKLMYHDCSNTCGWRYIDAKKCIGISNATIPAVLINTTVQNNTTNLTNSTQSFIINSVIENVTNLTPVEIPVATPPVIPPPPIVEPEVSNNMNYYLLGVLALIFFGLMVVGYFMYKRFKETNKKDENDNYNDTRPGAKAAWGESKEISSESQHEINDILKDMEE